MLFVFQHGPRFLGKLFKCKLISKSFPVSFCLLAAFLGAPLRHFELCFRAFVNLVYQELRVGRVISSARRVEEISLIGAVMIRLSDGSKWFV